MKTYKFLLLLLVTSTCLFGNVKLSISSNTIIKNEAFIFAFELFGSDIKFPNLDLIEGNIVQENSSSTSTKIINGQVSKSLKKSYFFKPKKDFTLPSFEFIIDGKKYYTKEKKISVLEASKTKSDLFDFTIKTNNTDLYIGENFLLTMIFKYSKKLRIENIFLEKPSFNNFWHKQLDDSKNYEEDDFIVSEINFLMAPLKEGELEIEALKINASILENNSYSLFSQTTDKNIYSNKLKFNIKKPPNDIKIIGDFKIEASVNKEKIKKEEAVSYKLKISGNGNIDGIEDIKLPLEGFTIYENKPIIKNEIKDDKYRVEYEKVFSIIADKSFEIPSISFEYFNKDLNKLVKKQTQSFFIEVEEDEKNQASASILEKEEKKQIKVRQTKENEIVKVIEKKSIKDRIIFFLFGLIVSLLIISLYYYVITSKRKKIEDSKPLIRRVKNTKTKEELIKILAIYIKYDSKLDQLIFNLEKTNNIKELKKEIIKTIKELKL